MEENKSKHEEWHKNPNNWKLGIFYFNREDKRIFPPKRIEGLGWTINFAHSTSILAFILLFVLIIAIIRWL